MLLESIIAAKVVLPTISITSWGVNAITSVFVTSTGLFIKGCYDDYRARTQDIRTRREIKKNSAPSEFQANTVEEYVDNPKLVSQLEEFISLKIGGLFVLGAPCGSGKTTYLNKAIENFQKKNLSRKLYYLNGISEETFESLDVPSGKRFSEFLPSGSVIIIDQAESKDDPSPKVFNLLIQLAVQSRNSKRFHTIIVVSSFKLMGDILNLNGGEKIYSVASTALLKWDEDRQLEFAKKLLPNWSSENQKALVAKVQASGSCGILFSLSQQLKEFPQYFDDEFSEEVEQIKRRASEWDEFSKYDKKVFRISR